MKKLQSNKALQCLVFHGDYSKSSEQIVIYVIIHQSLPSIVAYE